MNVALPFPARTTDPQTSQAAAIGDRSELRRQIRSLLLVRPAGLTDYEILVSLGLPERRRGSVAKRRHDLGCIDTGVRRNSPDGRPMIVWTLP